MKVDRSRLLQLNHKSIAAKDEVDHVEEKSERQWKSESVVDEFDWVTKATEDFVKFQRNSTSPTIFHIRLRLQIAAEDHKSMMNIRAHNEELSNKKVS